MNSRYKLTDADVINIHGLYKDGYKQTAIAKQYSVSQAQVQRILTGKRWKDLYCLLHPDSVKY